MSGNTTCLHIPDTVYTCSHLSRLFVQRTALHYTHGTAIAWTRPLSTTIIPQHMAHMHPCSARRSFQETSPLDMRHTRSFPTRWRRSQQRMAHTSSRLWQHTSAHMSCLVSMGALGIQQRLDAAATTRSLLRQCVRVHTWPTLCTGCGHAARDR